MTQFAAPFSKRLPQPHDDLPDWPAWLHWAPDRRHYWVTRLGPEPRRYVAVLPLPAGPLPETTAPNPSPTEVIVVRPGPRGWNWDEPEWRSTFATPAAAATAAADILDNFSAWLLERIL